jgi:DNA-binding response OmpR family regulator
MHMKRVIVVADEVHARAWIQTALGDLDLVLHYCPMRDLSSRLETDPGDLLVVDAGQSSGDVIALAEAADLSGADVRLLLVLEPGELDRLRMPVRLPADFVARGSSPAEVAARVRRLLWPGEEVSADEMIRIDDLSLNLATYQAHVHGVPVEFTYLEYTLFAFLVTHPNRVYSREVLLSRVWGTDYFGGARTVDVHVRRVRSKLGPELARRLETVRNVGYLWRR